MAKELEKTTTNTALLIPALQSGEDLVAVKEALAENIGAGQMSVFDFNRIKIAPGGINQFDLGTDSKGQAAVAPQVDVVVVYSRDVRNYWKADAEDNSGAPPDCSSEDCITGHGTPGGPCAVCPMSQFGSSSKGKGQACRQFKQLFVVRAGSTGILPEVMMIPPTSLSAYRKYGVRLANEKLSVRRVITTVTLHKEKSGQGQPYSEALFALARPLNEVEVKQAQVYTRMFEELAAKPTAPQTPAAGEKPAF